MYIKRLRLVIKKKIKIPVPRRPPHAPGQSLGHAANVTSLFFTYASRFPS